MNRQFNALIYSIIFSQRLLNKLLAKREINNRSECYPQLLFWCVEFLLRAHIAYFQHSYIPIHQFNKTVV